MSSAISALSVNFSRRASSLCLFLFVFLAIAAPRSAAWSLPTVGLIAGYMLLVSPRKPVLPVTDLLLHASCALFGLLIFLSTFWSASQFDTLTATVFFIGFFSAFNLAAANLETGERPFLLCWNRAFLWGVTAGAIYLLVELVSGSVIERFLFTYAPFIRPESSSHIGMVGEKVAIIAPDELNRGIGMLNLLAWPAVLVASREGIARIPQVAFALLALIAIVTFLSPHETSKAAVVLGTIVVLIFHVYPSVSRSLVVIGWLCGTLLIVPMAQTAYRANLHLAHWIPDNGRARLTIWAATSEKLQQHPWRGVGANATAAIDRANIDAETRAGHAYPWRTGMHPHNAYLQTWYELGVIGALLLCAMGLALLRLIFRLPDTTQPFVLGAFTSAATIAAFGYGMWQEWLMAGYFYAAIFTLAGIKVAICRGQSISGSGPECRVAQQEQE